MHVVEGRAAGTSQGVPPPPPHLERLEQLLLQPVLRVHDVVGHQLLLEALHQHLAAQRHELVVRDDAVLVDVDLAQQQVDVLARQAQLRALQAFLELLAAQEAALVLVRLGEHLAHHGLQLRGAHAVDEDLLDILAGSQLGLSLGSVRSLWGGRGKRKALCGAAEGQARHEQERQRSAETVAARHGGFR